MGGKKSIFMYLCFPEKNFERKLLTVGIWVTWGVWYCRENWADKEWRKEVFKRYSLYILDFNFLNSLPLQQYFI